MRASVRCVVAFTHRAGVLAATDTVIRHRRLDTLTAAHSLEPIPIDLEIGNAWARLRRASRDAGVRMPMVDSWIAATAMTLGVPIVTRDEDFPPLADLTVIHV